MTVSDGTFYSLKAFFLLVSRSECNVLQFGMVRPKVLVTLVLEAHGSNQTKSQSLRSRCVLIHQKKKASLKDF